MSRAHITAEKPTERCTEADPSSFWPQSVPRRRTWGPLPGAGNDSNGFALTPVRHTLEEWLLFARGRRPESTFSGHLDIATLDDAVS